MELADKFSCTYSVSKLVALFAFILLILQQLIILLIINTQVSANGKVTQSVLDVGEASEVAIRLETLLKSVFTTI